MALYQPTNITPDLKGGVQNGIILLPYTGTISNVTVSWTVNGNSQMTAYQIDFFQNTAASSQTGTTGKITLGTPFSAIQADGTQNRFSCTVPFATFAAAWVGTGTWQGKFKITMWWGSGANDYVEQRSLSVFEMSRKGVLSIASTDENGGGNFTFHGAYTAPTSSPQYFGRELNWTKWTVYRGSGSGDVIQTTGQIWGATSYDWTPEMLLEGTYYVSFDAEQANGASLHHGKTVEVYSSDFVFVAPDQKTLCNKAQNSISIYPIISSQISFTAGEKYYVWKGIDDKISAVPWNFIWHGTLVASPATEGLSLFEIICKDGTTIHIGYDESTGTFTTTPATTEQNPGQWTASPGDEIYVCVTRGNFHDGTENGTQFMVYSVDGSGAGIFFTGQNLTQKTISMIRVPTAIVTLCLADFTLGYGNDNSWIEAGYDDQHVEASFYGPKIVSTGATASVLYYGTDSGPFFVYRKEQRQNQLDTPPARLIGVFEPPLDPAYSPIVTDYTALAGLHYDYIICPKYNELGNYAASIVSDISPCFDGWSLVVGHKETQSGATYYAFYELFRFAYNVQSGSYTNGSGRNVQPTFTRYPAVLRSVQNRRQGTLSGLMGFYGNDGLSFGTPMDFEATNEIEEAARMLSSLPSDYVLVLISPRGVRMRIDVAGEISVSMNDASSAKELTVSVPWVEIGDGDVSVFGYDEFLPENTYISALFSPGSAKFYTTDTLDTLRQYLTVTQHYSNGATAIVTDYALSGTLNPGQNVIIVSYIGQTASFVVTVESLVIVPWSTGTDEQIANMITALDNGDITIADTGWQIGDERIVSLSAMEASIGGEAHVAQNVTLVLMDSQHYDLTDGGKDHFVVGFKECLAEGGQLSYSSTWGVTPRRTWCNRAFRNAIPETLRNCFKQFKCISANETGDTLSTTDDYFSLFAEKEIIGRRNKSSQIEANALTQIQWYATPANRIKDVSGFQYHGWWLRSHENRSWNFVAINANGASTADSYEHKLGLAPFGCI